MAWTVLTISSYSGYPTTSSNRCGKVSPRFFIDTTSSLHKKRYLCAWQKTDWIMSRKGYTLTDTIKYSSLARLFDNDRLSFLRLPPAAIGTNWVTLVNLLCEDDNYFSVIVNLTALILSTFFRISQGLVRISQICQNTLIKSFALTQFNKWGVIKKNVYNFATSQYN